MKHFSFRIEGQAQKVLFQANETREKHIEVFHILQQPGATLFTYRVKGHQARGTNVFHCFSGKE